MDAATRLLHEAGWVWQVLPGADGGDGHEGVWERRDVVADGRVRAFIVPCEPALSDAACSWSVRVDAPSLHPRSDWYDLSPSIEQAVAAVETVIKFLQTARELGCWWSAMTSEEETTERYATFIERGIAG